MEGKYMFTYINENEFKKLESALKKYNMLAFKKLYFEYYPKLKTGEFLGEMVGEEADADGHKVLKYEVKLPTDALFVKVHGEVKLHYNVISEKHTVTLVTLSPEDILREGHKSELVAYKGVMVSKENADKDKFKINLLNMINKN
ncbi:MAG: hypothetical protein IKJ43_03115 [Bacilli bacterium]|nr:hypothetical protein [Bacilli bacterium]